MPSNTGMLSNQEFLDFFFEASLNGWVGNAPEVILSEMPGFKVINYPKYGWAKMKGWFYRNAYSVNRETKMSAGFTNIWKDGEHQFIAGYGGHYPKEAIDFLKEALRDAYHRKTFVGGRARAYENRDYRYKMDPLTHPYPQLILPEEFFLQGTAVTQFSGTEVIVDIKLKKIVGWHNCWCASIF